VSAQSESSLLSSPVRASSQSDGPSLSLITQDGAEKGLQKRREPKPPVPFPYPRDKGPTPPQVTFVCSACQRFLSALQVTVAEGKCCEITLCVSRFDLYFRASATHTPPKTMATENTTSSRVGGPLLHQEPKWENVLKRGTRPTQEEQLRPNRVAPTYHCKLDPLIELIPILRLNDLRLPNRGGRWT
jgi:hypothetical protein